MVRTDYDEIAAFYDQDEVRAKTVNRHLVDFVAKHGMDKPGPIRVLDMACGTGNQLIANKAAYPEVEMCGIDKSEGMLEQARRKSADIAWLPVDVERDGLTLEAFDYISCQFAYHHFRDKRRFLANAYRNLADDGWFSLVNLDVAASGDWFVYRFFPAARVVDRRDFLESEALMDMAQSVGFEVMSRESVRHCERLSLQEIQRKCSRRHIYSELMAIRDSDYEAGMAAIRHAIDRGGRKTVESSVAILDVVFAKRT